MTDDMQIMGELDHQADFAMPEAPTGSKVYSSDRKVYLRFNDAVQRKAQEIGTPEPDQPEMSQEELMERIERFKNPKTTDTLVQMARTTAPEPVENTSPEAMLLNKNNELNNAYKIYELFEGEPFDGLPEDAIDYALDAMGEFSFNFLGPVSFAESGFDAGGTLAQAAHIISAQDPEKAKAFVDFMAEYERLPTWSYEGVGRAFRGIFSDPTTYATAGAGYFLSKAGTQVAATGAKRALQELAKRPMTLAAAEGAVYAGGGEEALMGVEEASGREISGLEKGLRRGISTTIGAAAGPTLMKGMQAGGQVIGEIAEAVGKPTMQAIGNVIEEAGDAAQARIDEPGEQLGMGVDIDPLIAGAGDAVAKFRAPTEKQPGVIAFHGSGADFDEFKLEKIGTGEGAQAYGYGLYFTDSEDIAKFYRQTVGGGSVMKNFSIGNLELVRNEQARDYSPGATPFGRGPYKKVQELTPKDYAQALLVEDIFINEPRLFNTKYTPGAGSVDTPKKGDELKQELIDIMYDTLEKIDQAEQPEHYAYVQNFINKVARGEAKINFDAEQLGKTYKVGLEPKPEDMLDYQTTFADQPKKVQDAVKALGFNPDVQFKITETGDGRFAVSSVDALGREETKDFVDGVMGKSAKQQAKEYALQQSKKMSQMPMPIILDQLKTIIAQEPRKPDAPSFKKKDAEMILSERLLEQGIPGVKYRAAGSRAANLDSASAEYNYVIFDDKMIKILEKYGIVGPVAITGVAASQQEGESANVDT